MAVFRVERNTGYTVMSNHHLRNKELSLKAKGLLSQMLSLPEDWDYTLSGLSYINRESIDAIRTAVWELEKAGYMFCQEIHGFRCLFQIMDFCPLLIAPAFLHLDTVLNINEQTNAAAICAGSFRSAGAFAAYPFSDSFLCIICAEGF